jgi:uncharacterized protein
MEAIKEKLDLLIILQDKDNELDKVKKLAAEVPVKIEGQKALIAGLRAELEISKKTAVDLQLLKKQKELDLETHENQIRKHNAELNSIKSNDAYKALLTEIENSRKVNSQLENDILEIMEKIETEVASSKEKEKILKLKETEIHGVIKCFEDELAKLQAEAAQLEAARNEYAAGIPPDVLKKYDWIRESREGLAVVSIDGENCSGCNIHLRPQIVNEVFKGQDFIFCDSCSRILYKK